MAIKTWASGDILTAADMNTYPLQKGVVTTKGDLLVGTTDSTVARQGLGTNNQILTVDTSLTNGIKWADGPAALLTAKGSILGASAANTPAAIAVGTNGYLLMADSQQTAGVRYGGPASEGVNIVASAATGTININLDTAPVWYYTTNASANHTINFRYSASVSFNTQYATGSAVTAVWMNTNGATAYYPNVIQVDGSAVTPKWVGGVAPSAGNASSIDVYVFTIIKTASATFTVLGSQTKYA